MATPTSEQRFVEAQLSIIKGALKRAQEAYREINPTAGGSSKILQTSYANKMREIRGCGASIDSALQSINKV